MDLARIRGIKANCKLSNARNIESVERDLIEVMLHLWPNTILP